MTIPIIFLMLSLILVEYIVGLMLTAIVLGMMRNVQFPDCDTKNFISNFITIMLIRLIGMTIISSTTILLTFTLSPATIYRVINIVVVVLYTLSVMIWQIIIPCMKFNSSHKEYFKYRHLNVRIMTKTWIMATILLVTIMSVFTMLV